MTLSRAVTVPKSTWYRLDWTLLETVQGRVDHGLRSRWKSCGGGLVYRNRNQSGGMTLISKRAVEMRRGRNNSWEPFPNAWRPSHSVHLRPFRLFIFFSAYRDKVNCVHQHDPFWLRLRPASSIKNLKNTECKQFTVNAGAGEGRMI